MLLNRIKVGKKDKKSDYSEARAVSLLSNLDPEGFRKLCHIPTHKELVSSGIPKKLADSVKRSIPFKLDGWLKLASRRAEQGRGWVHMFNKFKHHMLAFPTRAREKNEIWLPTSIRLNKKLNRIDLGQGWLESSTNELRELAGNAIGAQAVLHDTLASILVTRYSEEYIPPNWLLEAYQTDFALRSSN